MHPFRFQNLDSYRVAKQVCTHVRALKLGHRELRDQAERAALSSFLDLSEGLVAPPRSGVRKRHLAIALGSLGEVSAALDMAIALRLMHDDAELEALVTRLAAMLGALLR